MDKTLINPLKWRRRDERNAVFEGTEEEITGWMWSSARVRV